LTRILATIILVNRMKVFSLHEFVRRREQSGLSRRGLSIKAELGYNTVAALESGQIKSPTTSLIEALARALGCDPTDLYREEGDATDAAL